MNERKSKKEIEADALKAIEEAEAIKAKEADETTPTDPQNDEEILEKLENEEDTPVESEDEDEKADDTEKEEKAPIVPAKEEEPAKTPEELAKELEEKKAKLKASAQESIVLHSTNKKIQDSITQAAEMPMPTPEEMTKIYPNWEDMDEVTQHIARENEWNSRKIQAVTAVSTEFKEYNAWQEKVDKYITDPSTVANTPLLDGKEAEFKTFAMKPTRRGVDFEDLVKAFLFDADVKPSHKGAQLDTTPAKPKDNKEAGKLSAEQGRQLRENDYKKWLEYSKAGKIASAF